VERAFPIRLYDGTTAPPIREPKVTARLKKREPLSADDFSALKTMTRGPIKANLPTPSVAHFFTGDAVLDRRAYGNREEFMDDLARIMREEIAQCAWLHLFADGRGAVGRDLRSKKHGSCASAGRRSRRAH
jgi:methionine synthase II (cobalamin-independent)